MKAACLLIDQGCDVLGIGLVPETADLDQDQIAQFYLSWAHERWMIAVTEPSGHSFRSGFSG